MLDERTPRAPAPLLEVADPLAARPQAAAWRASLGRLARNRKALVSLAGLLLIIGAAVFGPMIYRVSPTDGDFLNLRAFPSATHPLGTDSLGRDTLARLLAGLRVTFFVVMFVEGLTSAWA